VTTQAAPLPVPDSERFDDTEDRSARRTSALLFLAIAVVMALDLLLDAVGGPWPLHAAADLGVVALALAGVWRMRAQILRAREVAGALRTDLLAARADAQRFRAESQALVRGLSTAIDAQLDAWACSPAEREVALMLLKGLSLKEVATLRGTSERTARQQALALYKKAGVAGRAELSAFFLEDLLPPAAQR
jgi:DNA-binding CsgD family transcriptional regulator